MVYLSGWGHRGIKHFFYICGELRLHFGKMPKLIFETALILLGASFLCCYALITLYLCLTYAILALKDFYSTCHRESQWYQYQALFYIEQEWCKQLMAGRSAAKNARHEWCLVMRNLYFLPPNFEFCKLDSFFVSNREWQNFILNSWALGSNSNIATLIIVYRILSRSMAT